MEASNRRRRSSGSTRTQRRWWAALTVPVLLAGMAAGLAGPAQAAAVIPDPTGDGGGGVGVGDQPPPQVVGAYAQIMLRLRFDAKNWCFDVKDASTNANANVIQYKCTGTDQQFWAPIDVGDGYVQLVNRRSGLCLDIQSDVPTVNGDRLQQFWCHPEYPSERWTKIPTTRQGVFLLSDAASGKCITGSTSPHLLYAYLTMRPCHSDLEEQQWRFV